MSANLRVSGRQTTLHGVEMNTILINGVNPNPAVSGRQSRVHRSQPLIIRLEVFQFARRRDKDERLQRDFIVGFEQRRGHHLARVRDDFKEIGKKQATRTGEDPLVIVVINLGDDGNTTSARVVVGDNRVLHLLSRRARHRKHGEWPASKAVDILELGPTNVTGAHAQRSESRQRDGFVADAHLVEDLTLDVVAVEMGVDAVTRRLAVRRALLGLVAVHLRTSDDSNRLRLFRLD